MAHLVPNPPPADYQVPTLTKFSVTAADGIGWIYAWGVDNPSWSWRVGTDIADQVISSAPGTTSYPQLKVFELRGVRKGMKLAIYCAPAGGQWTRYSSYVDVEANVGDKYADALAAGTLPKSRSCSHISFYPFGAPQASPPLSETEWMDKIEAALAKINGNDIGRAVLRNIKREVVIYPYMPRWKNAWSDVRINPEQWVGEFRPGASVDEILLHELIHVIEKSGFAYQDRWGFMFDKTDFLTVNATNVYSCMLGRALRKDHHDFVVLPDEHFRNPGLHWEQQKPNYDQAATSAPDLVRTLSGIGGIWNPFRYWIDDMPIIAVGI